MLCLSVHCWWSPALILFIVKWTDYSKRKNKKRDMRGHSSPVGLKAVGLKITKHSISHSPLILLQYQTIRILNYLVPCLFTLRHTHWFDDQCRRILTSGRRRTFGGPMIVHARFIWEGFVPCLVRANQTYSEAKQQFGVTNMQGCCYERLVLL